MSRAAAMVMAGAVLLWSPVDANAFEVRRDSAGEVVRWSGSFTLAMDRRLGAALGEERTPQAVSAAMRTVAQATPWLQVSLEVGEELEVGFSPQGANRSVLVASNDWAWAKGQLAATILTLNARTHEILDADIVINAEEFTFRNLDSGKADGWTNDLQNTLTHELGHALGLLHNHTDPDVVMYPSSAPGELKKRHLAQDDRDGLAFLYGPPSRAELKEEVPSTGCSASPGPSLVAVLGLLAAGLRRRTLAATLALVLVPCLALAAEPTRPVRPEPEPEPEPERVAIGEVVSARATWDSLQPGLIVTDVEVRVLACREPCDKAVTIRVLGGRVGDVEQVVAHTPAPAVDAQVLIVRHRGRLGLRALTAPKGGW